MKITKLPGLVLCICVFLLTPLLHGGIPQSWYSNTPTNKNLTAATYGQSQFLVSGFGSMIIKSPNGFSWQQSLPPNGPPGTSSGDHLFALAYGNGMFVAGGYGALVLSVSPDAVNWTNIQSTVGTTLVYGLTFANGRFVGVGRGAHGVGSAYLITSSDGINWQYPEPPTTNILHAVAYGNSSYVGVGDVGTVITSYDGSNWTVRNSGTTRNLRAVTFTGSRFLAGGEAATMLTSVDGISWSPSAPPAFDVTGLASGGGAVVAVGIYNGTDGRLHASANGLSWPGNPTLVSQPLNGVAYVNDRFMALGNNGLILQSDVSTTGATNSWTKTASGNWEEPYWSLGELPSINHAAIMFTNSGYKALAINNGTALNYPSSLQIQNLTVDAPSDSANLLLLNYAGSTPLQVNENLVIGYYGGLLSYGSALNAGTFLLGGRATFAEASTGQFTSAYVGTNSPGELNISNAVLSINRLEISGNVPGVVNQYGGSNIVNTMTLFGVPAYPGAYNLSNGTLTVSSSTYVGLQTKAGQFTASGGQMKFRGGLNIGAPSLSAAVGTFNLGGGALQSDIITVANGFFNQSGGSGAVGAMFLPGPGSGIASGNLSGGTLTSGDIRLGDNSFGQFTQSGGVHTNTNAILMLGRVRVGCNEEIGRYTLSGGRLESKALRVLGGQFTQTGGSNSTGLLTVEAVGECFLQGGVSRATNLFVGNSTISFQYSRLFQSAGSSVTVDSLSLSSAGYYGFGDGFLSASNITVGFNSEFHRGNVSFVNQGTFALAGGRFFTGTGSNQLGYLNVGDGSGMPSAIYFQPDGASVLRFRDSHTVAWGNGQLQIQNWAGSAGGGGRHQIYVGSSASGLTPAQLAKITFVNPAGFSTSNYPPRMLATGELVPDSGRPALTYSRTSNGLQLSWDPSKQELLSSTNVAGPYVRIDPQPSTPYTVNLNEPKRFFELQSRSSP